MSDKPSKQQAILIGAAVIAAISAVPGLNLINCCCCGGILFGGALAVYLHKKEYRPDMPPMESSDALMVGLLSGLLGAVGSTVISTLFLLAIGPVEAQIFSGIWEKVLDRLIESGTIPADLADDLREQMETSMSEAASFTGILSAFFFSIIIYPIFGMLGGLIGYGMFRTKQLPPQ